MVILPGSMSLSPPSRFRFFFFFFSSSAALWEHCKHTTVSTGQKAHDRRGSSDDLEDEPGKEWIG